MKDSFFSAETIINVEFYDVDSMRVVWHGNYIKFMEQARCALLERLNCGYLEMERIKCLFPLTDLRIKYIRSFRYGERVRAVAHLTEYETCFKIRYEFFNADTGELATKAESTQMAVDAETGESQFSTPRVFVERIERIIAEKNQRES